MSRVAQHLRHYANAIPSLPRLFTEGKLVRLVGLTLQTVGCYAPIGTRCLVMRCDGNFLEAEIVGFAEHHQYLMPIGSTQGLAPGAKVIIHKDSASVVVGEQLLGRIIDGAGNPLDDKGSLVPKHQYPLYAKAINPLQRRLITQPLDVGIRTINALLTVGAGQRIGLFAGSGVGKSILLGMMTRFTQADIIVVGLIGERGREVKEFIEHNIGLHNLKRTVIVAAPADSVPLLRLHGALRATTIAEYFRDQGANVLLIMDSLTRYAQAQREIALAIGEPPATKGYPPSVFTRLPQLIERAGTGKEGGGSITSFYTVLAEGDDQQDPIVDASRAILDGHIVLTRELAEAGHYPAIDIEKSISRVMPNIVNAEHLALMQQFRHLYAHYRHNQDLINIGAYVSGSDPLLDRARQLLPQMLNFLQQGINDSVNFTTSSEALRQLLAAPPTTPVGG
ncbi:MAG: flagellar protein export ATPase FliI [Gammaproteobacteria bacterium]